MQAKGPFSDIKVVDFTQWLAGPLSGNILSDLGADVIKVESPSGDQVRKAEKEGEAYLYTAYNHGKRGISINLKEEEGKKVAIDLLKSADVLIENFRPGVMDRLGLGYETIQSINHKIIYCSISAFGNTPNYRDRPGMDPIIQGMGGAMSMTGMDEHSPPLLPGIPIADNTTAFIAFGAIASALYERERSGKGQEVELNLLDMMVLNLTTRYGQYLASGENPKPMGNQHAQFVPYQAFPTKDGWIMAGAQADHSWKLFCEAIGSEDLYSMDKYKTNAMRVENREDLTELLNKIFRQKKSEEWIKILEEKGVLHGPIWGIDELINSEVIKDHNIVQEIEQTNMGKVPIIKTPIHFSRTKTNIQSGANGLGEHTKVVLKELGYSEDRIEKLISDHVVKSM